MVEILSRVICGGLSMEKVLFEQGSEEGEGVSYFEIWGTGIPRTRSSQCKGPEVGLLVVVAEQQLAVVVGGGEARKLMG